MHTRARARTCQHVQGDSQTDGRRDRMVSLGPHFMLERVSNE